MKIDVKKVAKKTKSEQLKDKAKKFFKETFWSFEFKNKTMEELGAGRRLMI